MGWCNYSLPDIHLDILFPGDPDMYPFDIDMPLYIAIDVIKASIFFMFAPVDRAQGMWIMQFFFFFTQKLMIPGI